MSWNWSRSRNLYFWLLLREQINFGFSALGSGSTTRLTTILRLVLYLLYLGELSLVDSSYCVSYALFSCYSFALILNKVTVAQMVELWPAVRQSGVRGSNE